MKVLFIGLGSIGRRNLESCLRVRPGYRYAAWRRGPSRSEDQTNLPALSQFHEWSDVVRWQPQMVWICNPTSLHAETVRLLGSLRPALFVEKPLAHTAADAREIAALVGDLRLPFFHGCLLRGHPLIRRVAAIVKDGLLGQALSYQIRAESYLPDWRPGRDYRTTYSARREMGGGVGVDLIHEFDYAELWFGAVAQIDGVRGQVSGLEIDSDDVCLATLRHQAGVVGQISLNYYRADARRDFEICFANGYLAGDLLSGKLVWVRSGAQSLRTEEVFVANRDFLHDRQTEEVFTALESGVPVDREASEVAALIEKVVGIAEIRRTR